MGRNVSFDGRGVLVKDGVCTIIGALFLQRFLLRGERRCRMESGELAFPHGSGVLDGKTLFPSGNAVLGAQSAFAAAGVLFCKK